MEHELLQRVAPLRDDEQAAGLAAGDERLLDRAAAGDELLALGERRASASCGASSGHRRRGRPGRPTRRRGAGRSPGRGRGRAAGPDARPYAGRGSRPVGRAGGRAVPGTGARPAGGRSPDGRAPAGAVRRAGRSSVAGGPAVATVARRAAGRARRRGRRAGRRAGRSPGAAGPPAPSRAGRHGAPAGSRPVAASYGRGAVVPGHVVAARSGRSGRAIRRRPAAGRSGRARTAGPARAPRTRAWPPADRRGRRSRRSRPRAAGGRRRSPGRVGPVRPRARRRAARALRARGPPALARRPVAVAADACGQPPEVDHQAPALAVARVLDRDAAREQLVAQPVRLGPVARRARGDPRVEHRLQLGLERRLGAAPRRPARVSSSRISAAARAGVARSTACARRSAG